MAKFPSQTRLAGRGVFLVLYFTRKKEPTKIHLMIDLPLEVFQSSVGGPDKSIGHEPNAYEFANLAIKASVLSSS